MAKEAPGNRELEPQYMNDEFARPKKLGVLKRLIRD